MSRLEQPDAESRGLERYAGRFELKADPDETGTFEGYASMFGLVDQGRDMVVAGAYSKSLAKTAEAGRSVKMLWQHDASKPIGKWLDLREDGAGLYVKGKITIETQAGREALALLRDGAIEGLSIGYRTIQAEKAAGGVRKLTEIDLHEVSLVTFPMQMEARVVSVKADTVKTEREFEAFLRDAGFSRKEATAIASHGFKGIAGRRDAASDDAQAEGLRALMGELKKLRDQIDVRAKCARGG